MTNDAASSEQLFQQLDDLVGDVIDRLSGEGHETAVVIGLSDALEKRQLAYDRDPDPEEEEPSNE